MEAAAAFLNKAVKPVLVGGVKLRAAHARAQFQQLADASRYAVAVMPNAKGCAPSSVCVAWRFPCPACAFLQLEELADAARHSVAGMPARGAFPDWPHHAHSRMPCARFLQLKELANASRRAAVTPNAKGGVAEPASRSARLSRAARMSLWASEKQQPNR